ncbi:hypothetical protein QTP86_005423 [Hemibagrus guttatus]|nr:hypothetical protein QTP86_005423 [Hemibagrus guttatus]
MYHGTTLSAARKIKRQGFKPSTDGMLGPGVYMSRSLEKAKHYPLDPKPGKRLAILKLRVEVRRVKKIDYQGHPLQKTWYENGYDTAVFVKTFRLVLLHYSHSSLEFEKQYKCEQAEKLHLALTRRLYGESAMNKGYGGHRYYTMYHGTTLAAAQTIMHEGFRRSADGMLGPGVYVSRSVDKAMRYPLNPPPGVRLAVLKLRVRVGRVKKIDYQGHPLQKTWHEQGYSTAWVPPDCGMVSSGLEEDCVWDPNFQRGLSSIEFGGRRYYIMYHGTTLEAAKQIKQHGFRCSSGGMLGPGVYVSRSIDKAKRYPLKPEPGTRLAILKLRVRVGKVKKIDRQGHPLQKTWHNQYDTAWVPPNCGMVPSGLEEDCVWDPNRIEVLDMYYIMYHGTTLEAAKQIKQHGFRRSSGGMLGPGVYVSRSIDKAKRYPLKPEPGTRLAILKLRVRVGKVKKIDRQGHPLQKTWHIQYDTAWVPPNCGMVPSGLEEDCVWDPNRIEVLDMWEVERNDDDSNCRIL